MSWTNFQLTGVPQGAREALWQYAGTFRGQMAWAQILDTPTRLHDLGGGGWSTALSTLFSHVWIAVSLQVTIGLWIQSYVSTCPHCQYQTAVPTSLMHTKLEESTVFFFIFLLKLYNLFQTELFSAK